MILNSRYPMDALVMPPIFDLYYSNRNVAIFSLKHDFRGWGSGAVVEHRCSWCEDLALISQHHEGKYFIYFLCIIVLFFFLF